MGIQLIRLSQIQANLPEFVDFEQQLIAMFGEQNTEKFVATVNQQTFTLSKSYTVGKNSLKVFVNGILQLPGDAEGYIELNQKMIAFTEPLVEGDIVIVIRNNFHSLANAMGKQRVKAYDIYRQTYFVTISNVDQLVFAAPYRYQIGLNQLKVYANGLLLTCGVEFDYIETAENEFKLNRTFPIGTTITAEVISGGLYVYRCDRYPVFIDATKSVQRLFSIPKAFVPGSNNLKVYLNGQLLRKGLTADYTEMDSNKVLFDEDLPIGSILEFEITTFTVDVFKIIREEKYITSSNITEVEFTTTVPYTIGESNLRVYANGILLREGITEDYIEVNENKFKFNDSVLIENSTVEYEIITW